MKEKKLKNKQKPMVSVILPVHNGANYLEECLDSVVSQKYENFDVIAVDDASSDSTPDILSNYAKKHPFIKFFRVKKQETLADVLNFGLSKAKGKYIARIDHDDLMMPDRLVKQVNFMESHPDVIVSGSNIVLIDENGTEINRRKYPVNDKELKEKMFIYSPFAHPSVIMRTKVLREVGGYPRIRKVEDIKLWFILGRVGKFSNLSEFLTKYRVHSSSISSRGISDHFWKVDSIRKWAIKKLRIKVPLSIMLIWRFQKLFFGIVKFLPFKLGYILFEQFRKFF